MATLVIASLLSVSSAHSGASKGGDDKISDDKAAEQQPKPKKSRKDCPNPPPKDNWKPAWCEGRWEQNLDCDQDCKCTWQGECLK